MSDDPELHADAIHFIDHVVLIKVSSLIGESRLQVSVEHVPRDVLHLKKKAVFSQKNTTHEVGIITKGTQKRNVILGNSTSLQHCLTQLVSLPPPSICLGPSKSYKKVLFFGILHPCRDEIDYVTTRIVTKLIADKIELENSLNWLSTLGGAFSALGENDQNFAMKAGKVSKSQLYIAIKLGSPFTMSRCRLYAAISLIQIGNLKDARKILLREYNYAKSLRDDADPRLRRMCLGIWCKLKYEWNRAKKIKTA